MISSIILLSNCILPILSIRLLCGNFSQTASVEPSFRPTDSGVLVTWDLISADPICTDPSRIPTFSNLRLSDVSVITRCDECPKCTLRMPMKYEMPLGYALNTIYVITKQIPFHIMKTDMDIRFVIVDKLPKQLRNCQIIVNEVVKTDNLFTLQNFILFLITFILIFFCLCLMRCLCSKIA